MIYPVESFAEICIENSGVHVTVTQTFKDKVQEID